VGILTTGNELVDPGFPEAGRPGRVVNSCRCLLEGLVSQIGAERRHLGTLLDHREALRAALVSWG
jgi:molybdopterin biosynthesis enzyme